MIRDATYKQLRDVFYPNTEYGTSCLIIDAVPRNSNYNVQIGWFIGVFKNKTSCWKTAREWLVQGKYNVKIGRDRVVMLGFILYEMYEGRYNDV